MNFLTKIRVLLQMQRAILFQYGWMRAWRENKPIDRDGNPVPWITYPAIDFLSQFNFSTASVFEWGSGASTIWWSKRCKQIATVESNPNWIPYITPLLPKSVDFIVTPLEAAAEVEALYSHHTVENDIFVIDNHGPFRKHCASAAVKNLAEGGIIILDNSDMCLEAASVIRESGFTQIDFTGFIPGGGYPQTTSIFFRERPRFPALKDWPARSVAQPNPPWENC